MTNSPDSITPPDFISHSMSRAQLQYIFDNLLPDLRGKVVLVVGSRLGAVLWGVMCYPELFIQNLCNLNAFFPGVCLLASS